MQCADMRGNSIKLQNEGKGSTEYLWYFIIDTCASLADVTGATNCAPEKVSRSLMHEFVVTTKTATQFFSEKTYIDNNEQLDSEFVIERFSLSRSLAMLNHF